MLWDYVVIQLPLTQVEEWQQKLSNMGSLEWEAVCILSSDASQYLLMKREKRIG